MLQDDGAGPGRDYELGAAGSGRITKRRLPLERIFRVGVNLQPEGVRPPPQPDDEDEDEAPEDPTPESSA